MKGFGIKPVEGCLLATSSSIKAQPEGSLSRLGEERSIVEASLSSGLPEQVSVDNEYILW